MYLHIFKLTPLFLAFAFFNDLQAQKTAIDWDPKLSPYPIAKRENITFSFRSALAGGNVSVPDAYNYFERLSNSSSKEIKTFNEEQDQLIDSYLIKVQEEVNKIQTSINQAGQFSKLSIPSGFGPKGNLTWLYGFNEAGYDQGAYYIATQAELDEGIKNTFIPLPGKIILNESALGPNKSAYNIELNSDCTKFSFTVGDNSGTGVQTIAFIRNISSPLLAPEDMPNHYPETYTNTRGTDLHWHPNGKGIFYEYEEKVKNGTSPYVQARLYYHQLGDDSKNDILIIKPILDHVGGLLQFISDDQKFLMVYTFDKERLFRSVYVASLDQQPLSSAMKWIGVQVHSRNDLGFLTNIGTTFYFMTNTFDYVYDNVNDYVYYAIRIDFEMKEAVESTDLQNVPQTSAKKETVTPIPKDANTALWIDYCVFDLDKALLVYMIDASIQYFIYNLTTGKLLGKTLSDYLNVDTLISCNPTGTDVFIDTMSFAIPQQVFHFKWDSTKTKSESSDVTSTTVFNSAFEANYTLPIDFKAEQSYAKGKDGVRIPYFLVYRNGIKLDGSHPAIVTFPSAYNDTRYPVYDPLYYSFLYDYDGILIIPGPRGSRQIAQDSWHQDGTLDKKQNTFDDVIAVLHDVIDRGFTSAGQLILNVELASAMAALVVANQASEGLIGAIIAKNGFYDLLHLQDSNDAKERIDEFGNPQVPKAFDWLDAYSPLQNIKSNKTYPTIVIVQGTNNDDKSEPWQGEKMIAELQHKLPNNSFPLLLANFQSDEDEVSEAKALAIAVHSLGFQRVH